MHPVFEHGRHWLRRLTAALCLALATTPIAAQASLSVVPVVVDFRPDQPPRADIELFNDGNERLYIVIEASRIEAPGSGHDHRVQDPDPQKLGLLATPSRLILEPGQRKYVRVAMLLDPDVTDRIYRVTVKPVVGELNTTVSGLKILVGYDLLVIQRPATPHAEISATRAGNTLTLRNTGNTNAELFNGQQCESEAHCKKLPAHRVYAGETWNVPLTGGGAIEYSVKVGGDVARRKF